MIKDKVVYILLKSLASVMCEYIFSNSPIFKVVLLDTIIGKLSCKLTNIF